MIWLALKTLLQERGRLMITLLGIAVSTVLTLSEVAIYIGMMGNATAMIRNTDADIWVTSKNIQSVDFALPFPEQRINQVNSLPEIVSADKILLTYGFIKLADGGRDQIQLIFTTIPLVFVSYNELQRLMAPTGIAGQTAYIVAKVKDPARIDAVAQALRGLLRDNDVYTREEFMRKTMMYWTVQTGMGMAFFLTALLAVLIGGAVVGQAIFASTMEHLREYGTLKALGAKNRDIYLVIFTQAGISGVLGYALGAVLLLAVKGGIEKAGVPLDLSWTLGVTVFAVMVLVCLMSAFFSVRKVRRLDPVTVFKA